MFYLITEGGVHTIAYFYAHKVYPDTVIFDTHKVTDYIPYFSDEDDVLVVIHGLIDWSLTDVHVLLRDLKDATNVNSLLILSDINLGSVGLPIMEYSGDIFGLTTKGKTESGKTGQVSIMDRYKKYDKEKKNLMIVEKEEMEDDVLGVASKRIQDFEELSKRVVRIIPQYYSKK